MFPYSVKYCQQRHRQKNKTLLPNQISSYQYVDKVKKICQCDYCPKHINKFMLKQHILDVHYDQIDQSMGKR